MRPSTAVSYDGEMAMIVEYEQHTEEGRAASYALNPLRRHVLAQAARALEDGRRELSYSGDGEKFLDVPYEEIQSAVRVLEAWPASSSEYRSALSRPA
jgi:hypothetical protein